MVKDYVGYVMLVGQLREGWRYQIDDYDNDFDEDYNYDNENRHNNNGDRKKNRTQPASQRAFWTECLGL